VVDRLFGERGDDALWIDLPERARVDVCQPDPTLANGDRAATVAVKLLHDFLILGVDARQRECRRRDPHGSFTERDFTADPGRRKRDALGALVGFGIDAFDDAFLLAIHPQRAFAERERSWRGQLDRLLDQVGARIDAQHAIGIGAGDPQRFFGGKNRGAGGGQPNLGDDLNGFGIDSEKGSLAMLSSLEARAGWAPNSPSVRRATTSGGLGSVFASVFGASGFGVSGLALSGLGFSGFGLCGLALSGLGGSGLEIGFVLIFASARSPHMGTQR
jgi:hypothetical protein